MTDELEQLRRDNHRLASARRMLLDPSIWMAQEDIDDLNRRYHVKRPEWLTAFRYRSGAVTEYNRITGKWRAGVLGDDEILIVESGRSFTTEHIARSFADAAAKKLAAGGSLKEVGAL